MNSPPAQPQEKDALGKALDKVMKYAVSVIEQKKEKPTLKGCMKVIKEDGRKWLDVKFADVSYVNFSHAGWKKIVKREVHVTSSKQVERAIMQSLEAISSFQPKGATLDDLWSFFQAALGILESAEDDEVAMSWKAVDDGGLTLAVKEEHAVEQNASPTSVNSSTSDTACWDRAAVEAFNGRPHAKPACGWAVPFASQVKERRVASAAVMKKKTDHEFWQGVHAARTSKFTREEVYEVICYINTKNIAAYMNGLMEKQKLYKKLVQQLNAARARGGKVS
ncbi:hypothetical protein RvY_18146 [Ramazzottius varieornatus]|uniref:Uncharacterized protein n=1 Tax=Ramazzottius varieornatus TaxID=947166 RepID=A0A1D1W6H4_RAMVA|nr:hypothetical protein RvY_18146 [Ramazzottius varieornatus]